MNMVLHVDGYPCLVNWANVNEARIGTLNGTDITFAGDSVATTYDEEIEVIAMKLEGFNDVSLSERVRIDRGLIVP